MTSSSPTIPVGYKQTEIGVIPEDWELKTFGEIFDFKPTASNSRSDLTESDTTHYIHYGDIHTVFHRHLDLEKRDTPMISRELCKNAALVKNGDWVMADASEDYSGIGKAIEISGIKNDSNVVAGLHTFLLRDRAGVYVPGFKGHLGEAKYLHDQYVRVSVGLKVFGVTKTSLRDLFIPVPPKSEQIRIEEVLTDSDSQIQALENLITKKRDIKQGTMQELLTGKTRLPGFSGEWQSYDFNQVLKKINSKQHQIKSSEYEDFGAYPVVDQGKKMVIGYSNRNEKIFNCPNDGVIIFGDHTCIIKYVNFNFIVGADGTQILHGNTNFSTRFIAYYLETNPIDPSGYNRHFKLLKQVIFRAPKYIEQEAIAEILSDMDAEIAALEQRLEKTKAIKQGMMQQLLTGRIRLVDPSTPVEANE